MYKYIKNNSKYLFSSFSTKYPCLDEPKDRICTVLLDMCVYIETFSRANYNPSACCLKLFNNSIFIFKKSSSSRIHLKMPIKRVNKVSWGDLQKSVSRLCVQNSWQIICAWKSNSWDRLLLRWVTTIYRTIRKMTLLLKRIESRRSRTVHCFDQIQWQLESWMHTFKAFSMNKVYTSLEFIGNIWHFIANGRVYSLI